MAKNDDDTIKEFNEVVNMTADELEAFLKTDDSKTTGWTADGGDGESVGHQSGRKIVNILKRNPSKDPSKYTDEDKQHMHKVVAYCKRHLAQEGHMKDEKSAEELKKTKSYRSLKNWGHDPLKGSSKGGAKPASKKAEKPASKKAEKPESKKAEKPASKKAEKPVSKKAEAKEDKKDEEKAEKPKSKGAAKKAEDADTGDKREAEGAAEKSEKPASKKAKTTKPPSEGTRKPPSRGAKKA